jgi:glycosyltransferase involved in cell wall biosynthesis
MNNANIPKINLLVFIYSMGDGGAERVTASLTNHWAAMGWQITLVTLAPITGDLFDLHPAIQRISLDMATESSNQLLGLWYNIGRIKALRKVLKEIRPDIALGMMTTGNVLLALASLGVASVKTIGSEHTHPPQLPLGYLWETLRSHTYGLLNAVTCLSSEGKIWIEKNTSAKNILVIPNAAIWPIARKDPLLMPGVFVKKERRLLLAAGRLATEKGYDGLIQVFSKLVVNHAEWDLVIVGEGQLRVALEQQIERLGLQNRVFLPGRAGNIGDWYERADLFVLSSHFEGFPLSLLEAMAYGLPVVSFDCDTGPRDIIRDQTDGILVRPGDLDDLAVGLNRLMSDDSLRKKYAERAIEVREKFSISEVTGKWEKLFLGLLHGSVICSK